LVLAAITAGAACSRPRPRLTAERVEAVPRPNRTIEWGAIWGAARPARLTLAAAMAAGRGSRPVELRAIHDGEAVAFLAIWPDVLRSDPGGLIEGESDSDFVEPERLAWVWNDRSGGYFLRQTPTDFFAFKFRIAGDESACMLNGREGLFDVWLWRAGWSRHFGYAEDLRLRISRAPLDRTRARAYPLPGSREPIYLQWIADAGRPPYRDLPRPTEFRRPATFAIVAHEPTESAGDVLAEAVWENGFWMLEVRRALATGHPDDAPLVGRGPHRLSIALGDEEEGGAHFTSELIDLYLK